MSILETINAIEKQIKELEKIRFELSSMQVSKTPSSIKVKSKEFKIPKDVFENKSIVELNDIRTILEMFEGKPLSELKTTLKASVIVAEYNSTLNKKCDVSIDVNKEFDLKN